MLTASQGVKLSASRSTLFDVAGTTAVLNCEGGILTINDKTAAATLFQGSQSGAYAAPGADNAFALGLGVLRWSVIYAATGAINTSDAREKTALRPPSAAEKRAIRRILAGVGVYWWLASAEAKGADHSQGGALACRRDSAGRHGGLRGGGA